jgi:superfamily II DNA/RNA helicase
VSAFISQKLKRQTIQYYAGLPSDQRSINLHKFMNESFDILVSTDLGSRGLDFPKPLHTVIEYDLSENIVNFINRAGRTARNELPGEIISFVEDKNKIFFEQLA